MTGFNHFKWLVVVWFLCLSGAEGWAASCSVFGTNPSPKFLTWRSKITYGEAKGANSKSSVARERKIRELRDELQAYIDNGETPEMQFVAESGVRSRQTRWVEDYPSSQTQRFHIRGIGKAGKVRATLILPVSAHMGAERARKWARDDRYDILRKQGRDTKTLVSRKRSKGPVTIQEIEVQLQAKGSIEIQYRRGDSVESASPYAHPAARIIELYWDGT